jgi:hypothetical protein
MNIFLHSSRLGKTATLIFSNYIGAVLKLNFFTTLLLLLIPYNILNFPVFCERENTQAGTAGHTVVPKELRWPSETLTYKIGKMRSRENKPRNVHVT